MHCKFVQDYSTMAKIISLAFGGSDEPEQQTPENFLAASMQFNAVLGGTA